MLSTLHMKAAPGVGEVKRKVAVWPTGSTWWPPKATVGASAAGSGAGGLAAGAPPDFGKNAVAALDALAGLDEGSARLSGSQWSLAGTVATAADRDALIAQLSAATDVSQWQISLAAKDTAPVVTPYLWSATKTADGAIAISGYVSSGKLKGDIGAKLGTVARDTTTLASGQPTGFENNVLAALDAPVFSSPSEQRAVSTTPLQALLLLNGRLVNDEAAHFARRVT